MLQVVHDLAPHAKLAFASGLPTETAYAENIEKLAAPVSAGGAGADVIVDDLSYPTEPFFQDGPIAVAIKRVTEKGVIYFSAAANENLFNSAGEEISSWEAPKFRSSTNCNAESRRSPRRGARREEGGPYEPECMDFDPERRRRHRIRRLGRSRPARDRRPAVGGTALRSEIGLLRLLRRRKSAAKKKSSKAPADNVLGPEPTLILESGVNESSTPQEVTPGDRPLRRRLQPGRQQNGQSAAEVPVHRGRLRRRRHRVPERQSRRHRRRGRADDLRPRRRRRREHDRRGQLGRIEHGPESARALLLARPGDPLLRPGRRARRRPPNWRSPEVLQKPDITATDCASTTFFDHLVEGVG